MDLREGSEVPYSPLAPHLEGPGQLAGGRQPIGGGLADPELLGYPTEVLDVVRQSGHGTSVTTRDTKTDTKTNTKTGFSQFGRKVPRLTCSVQGHPPDSRAYELRMR